MILSTRQVNPAIIWHAYAIRSFVGYSHNVHTMVDEQSFQLLKEYLNKSFDNEWDKKLVLDILRDSRKRDIEQLVKTYLPSICKKRNRELVIPEEATEIINDHIEAARDFRDSLQKLKMDRRELEVENITVNDTSLDGVMITVTRVQDGKKVDAQVNAGLLTLDNFRELTGRRFRVSQDQKQRLGDPKQNPGVREEAFREFMAEAVAKATNTTQETDSNE